jgi:hypothetical protein
MWLTFCGLLCVIIYVYSALIFFLSATFIGFCVCCEFSICTQFLVLVLVLFLCWSWRIQFSSIIGRQFLSIAFIGSRLIGLYELASSSGFPGSGIIMICATFHWTGKYRVLIIALHITVRWIMLFLGVYLNILPVIRSYPGAFLGLRSFCIMFWNSFGVGNLIGYVTCSGSFTALLISVSRSSFCCS